MVGKGPSRKELRAEVEAAEVKAAEAKAAEAKAAKGAGGVKKTAKKKTTRKSRAKPAKEVRLKAFWGVFSQSLTAVVLFEYNQRKEADKRAEQLSKSRKSPHFVQLVKKVIEE